MRLAARDAISDAELDDLLGEIDEQREQIAAELRATEDATALEHRLRAVRAGLPTADSYDDPDVVPVSDWFSLAASPEERRQAYRRYGARF